jgi:hypothetical protein
MSGTDNNSNGNSVCDCIKRKKTLPKGIVIDGTAPLAQVVDEIVRQSEANEKHTNIHNAEA